MRTSDLAESRPKETLEQVRTSRCFACAISSDTSSARRTQKALRAIQQNIEAVLSGNPTPEVRLDGVDDSESDGCARQPHRMSDLVLIRRQMTESTAGRVCCVIRLRSSRTRRRSASIRVRAQPRAQLVCPSYALFFCAFSASILISNTAQSLRCRAPKKISRSTRSTAASSRTTTYVVYIRCTSLISTPSSGSSCRNFTPSSTSDSGPRS